MYNTQVQGAQFTAATAVVQPPDGMSQLLPARHIKISTAGQLYTLYKKKYKSPSIASSSSSERWPGLPLSFLLKWLHLHLAGQMSCPSEKKMKNRTS
jgi:hypothetical protein